MLPRIVCIASVLPVHITVVYTGQIGHERDSFLRKDDSCDRTFVIYIYIELDIYGLKGFVRQDLTYK